MCYTMCLCVIIKVVWWVTQQGGGWFVEVDRMPIERIQFSLSGLVFGQIPYFSGVPISLCVKRQ